MRSQDTPEAYRPNGAIHVMDVNDFKREARYFLQTLVDDVMPLDHSNHIDTELDLDLTLTTHAASRAPTGGAASWSEIKQHYPG
jgi:CMP-N-acetylneuraminic acid synthetase